MTHSLTIESLNVVGGWNTERVSGGAEALHRFGVLPADFPFPRTMRINEVSAPALVMSSTQDTGIVLADVASRSGVDVVRRRSGGGLVHLVPGQHIWVDLFIARSDPLWVDDVSRSMSWVGELWVKVFRSLGVVSPAMHSDPWTDPQLGRLVCFAATGPGEVTVDGHKLVGISQRRTRQGARFQCTVYLNQDLGEIVGYINPEIVGEQVLTRVRTELDSGVTTLERLGLAHINQAHLTSALCELLA